MRVSDTRGGGKGEEEESVSAKFAKNPCEKRGAEIPGSRGI